MKTFTYKAVIFDFDDTLVESRELKWAHHKHVAKKFYGMDLTDADIKSHWGKPLNTLIGELYRNADSVENITNAILSVKDDFQKDMYEKTPDVIKALLDNNVQVGIVSATTKDFLMQDMHRLELPFESFFLIQGSDEVSAHKPDPKVFDSALELLSLKGITKDDILYVGDSLDDFTAASGARIHFIALTTGLYSKEQFTRAGAKLVLGNISELLTII